MIKTVGERDLFSPFTHGLFVVWDKLFNKQQKKQHLLLTCGTGEVPGCMVESEASYQGFCLVVIQTEGRCSSRPLGPLFFFSSFPVGPRLTLNG